MKRNTRVVDNDSDNEIWHYKSDRQLKHSKLRRSGKDRTKITSTGKKNPLLSHVGDGSMKAREILGGKNALLTYETNPHVSDVDVMS